MTKKPRMLKTPYSFRMPITKEEMVRGLKKLDMAILYWTVMDLTTDEVAAEVDRAASDVNYHLKSICARFAIEGVGREQREMLIRSYKNTVMEIIKSPEDLKNWNRQISKYEEKIEDDLQKLLRTLDNIAQKHKGETLK